MLYHCLLLVQARETSIHALVQSPALDNRDVELVTVLQGEVAGLDGTLQEGREAHVELKTLIFNQCARSFGLSDSFLAQVHVHPARELVGNIPLRLTMPREDQLRVSHGSDTYCYASRKMCW